MAEHILCLLTVHLACCLNQVTEDGKPSWLGHASAKTLVSALGWIHSARSAMTVSALLAPFPRLPPSHPSQISQQIQPQEASDPGAM